jgi:hypothetical protein
LAGSFYNVFNTANIGANLTAVKDEHRKNLAALGLRTNFVDSYFDALRNVVNALNWETRSSESDRIEILKAIDDYINIGFTSMKDQPGLEDLSATSVLRDDPLNDEFFAVYDGGMKRTNAMKHNIGNSDLFFDNDSAVEYAHLLKLAMDVSRRAVAAMDDE